MVSPKAAHVDRYFHSFMTMDERVAHKHLIATAKARGVPTWPLSPNSEIAPITCAHCYLTTLKCCNQQL